ncbi:hypothetical protein ACJIZ3_011029 [Penstemon smallii]|uniref:RING-CH-type domain-containing protein n=1 Tax=Penstemon smallii TaxID=265156 RepID=A0ABD3UJD8_9LAMI
MQLNIWYLSCEILSSKTPSFENKSYDQMAKGLVMIKDKTTLIRSNNSTSDKTIIPREEAICRFCFNPLLPVDNNNNLLKTKCGCPLTLTHELCATEMSKGGGNNKCDVCDQDVCYVPVTLSLSTNTTTKTISGTDGTLKKIIINIYSL